MKIYSASLSLLTTMQLGGEANIVELESEAEVEDFFNNIDEYNVEHNLHVSSDLSNVRIIGGGSNVLVGDDVKDIVFVKLMQPQYNPLSPTDSSPKGASNSDAFVSKAPLGELREAVRGSHEWPIFGIWAGTSWDDFVVETVEEGYKDLAYLSLIPGTVGAAPVQNIGAYGAEVKDTITEVRGYDFVEKKWKTYTNSECDFSYRHSRFQKEKSFLITRVVFALGSPRGAPRSGEGVIYPSLRNLITENSTTQEIRDAVISVRDSKLPRAPGSPRGAGGELIAPSVGSFFHNPIVRNDIAEKLKNEHSDMPLYEYNTTHKKLSAGWLIEHSNCASIQDDTFHFYKNNHLVITHRGGATLNNLLSFAEKIKDKVKEKFGVELHIEPEIIQ